MKFYQKHTFLLLAMLVTGLLIWLAACAKQNNGPGEGPSPGNELSATVSIKANEQYQVIQGFGCATVFRPATTSLTAAESERLFGQGNGQVGLNILRIRIADDANWRAIELANALGAISHGAKVIASPWSPPARFKTNNNLIGGSLKTDSSAAYATYLNDFANFMSSNGAPLYAVSVQNEPDISVTYESCDWTAEQMKTFIANYGNMISSTRIMAPESFNNNLSYTNTILSDPAAAANIDIVAGHIYGSGVVPNTVAKNLNKEVWMTEHLDTNFNYTAAIATAAEIHDCLTKANFNAYLWWYGKRFYGPIGEDGLVTKRGFILSQFSKFIPPGSVRLGAGESSKPDVLVSVYQKPSGKKIIVAINKYAATVNQTFTTTGATLSQMTPYTTSETANVAAGTAITVSSNSFSYKLPPYSVTTFVEQ